jgi:hypothetical protein
MRGVDGKPLTVGQRVNVSTGGQTHPGEIVELRKKASSGPSAFGNAVLIAFPDVKHQTARHWIGWELITSVEESDADNTG